MRYVVAICWIVTALCAVVVGVGLALSLAGPGNANMKVSVATISLSIVALPYIFTRAIEGIWKS